MQILSKLYRWLIRHRIIEVEVADESGSLDEQTKQYLRIQEAKALQKQHDIEFENRSQESYYCSMHRWANEEKDRLARQANMYGEMVAAKAEMQQKVENLLKLLTDETTVRFYREAETRPPQDPSLEWPYPKPTFENPRLGPYEPYKFGDTNDGGDD